MLINDLLRRILDKVADHRGPTREDCRYLLGLGEQSPEAGVLVATADYISRRRFHNHALLLGQIGMESRPCHGRCQFCAFAEGGSAPDILLGEDQVLERVEAFCRQKDLHAIFLMTMHDTDFARLLNTVSAVRKALPPHTQIVANTGDLEESQGNELRSAGANGAYHICRLREGIDTGLLPARRVRTLETIREAGLDLYYCCEPIGPEHTAEEIVEQMFLGIGFGCVQHGAMRRVPVPGTPLFTRGQITERRLAQIVAVASLATLGCKETEIIIVHEPCLLGLCAGANAIYAEAGSNPRDTASDTSGHRGLDMRACREMLLEAGFEGLRRGSNVLPLTRPD